MNTERQLFSLRSLEELPFSAADKKVMCEACVKNHALWRSNVHGR